MAPKFMELANFGAPLLIEHSGFVHDIACLFEVGSRAVGYKHGSL